MNPLISFVNALPGACAQGLIWGIVGLGVFISFRVLNTSDLTVDGSIATGGAVCVMLLRSGMNPVPAVLCAALAGCAAGFVTGLLHTKCGIPAILSGILTQLALYSVNLRIMQSKANQPVSVDKYRLLISQRYVGEAGLSNPIPLLLLLCCLVIGLSYWFFGTETGCALRATGNNRTMASAQGIDTSKHIVLGLMISNSLVALSGGLLAQYQGFADINMGRGAIVIGLAAVIIGEVAFRRLLSVNFALRMLTVILGSVIYYWVLQLVLALGLNTNDLKLITAVIVAAALSLPYLKGKKKNA
ncbi:MAG: ABC transporter permease [Firmicutes bacterium]|nr:ABC transporter permease [Bacillota bacterium]